MLCASAASPCALLTEFEHEFSQASNDEQAILQKAMAQGQFDRVVVLAPRFRDDTGAFMPTRLVRQLEVPALPRQGDFAHAVKLFDQLLERIPDSVVD